MFFTEGEKFLPAVHRLLLAIGRPVIVEKAMARAVVAMKLVALATFLSSACAD
jgi:hypothetical protein